jgi:hypothetical protein
MAAKNRLTSKTVALPVKDGERGQRSIAVAPQPRLITLLETVGPIIFVTSIRTGAAVLSQFRKYLLSAPVETPLKPPLSRPS